MVPVHQDNPQRRRLQTCRNKIRNKTAPTPKSVMDLKSNNKRAIPSTIEMGGGVTGGAFHYAKPTGQRPSSLR